MTETRHCSFCRAPKGECAILIQGPEAAICGTCVATCVRSVMDPPKPPPKIETPPLIVRP